MQDAGFSMIDLAISVGLFGLVMAMLGSMMATGMRGIVVGRQRENAAQDAGDVLEVARSLSYENVGLSLADPTIATDPAIVTIGGVKKYLVDASTNLYEPLLWATTSGAHPFNPHRTIVTRRPTTLTRYVYVTGVDTNGDGATDYKRITARVEWTRTAAPGGSNEVRAQTFVSESGITPVNPPGGAGVPPLAADALAIAGSASIKADRGATTPVDEASAPSVVPVLVTLPATTGRSKVRAVSEAGCTARSTTLQGQSASYGNHAVSVSADDDPTTSTPEDPPPQSWSGIDTIGSGDDVDVLLNEGTMVSPVACMATAVDDDGVDPTDDDLPYELGNAPGPGSLTFAQDITGTGLGTNVLRVLSFGSPSVQQSIDHKTTGTRVIESSSSGSMGETKVIEIGGVLSPGLVRVRAFSYAATAAASSSAPPPPGVMVTGLVIDVFDPAGQIPASACTTVAAGYCTVVLEPDQPGFSGWSQAVNQEQSFNLGLTRLRFESTVDVLPPSMTPPTGQVGSNGETIWESSYTAVSISARLRIDVTIDVVLGTQVTLTDTMVDLTLGTISAKGCYGVTC